jgi:hypothetical protein
MAAQPAFGLPTGAQKLKEVTELVEALTEDLEEDQFLPDGESPGWKE